METIAPLFWVGRGETTIALNCSYELAGGEACTELLVDVVEEEGHDGTLSGEDLKKSLGAFLSTVGPFPPPPPPFVFIASEDVLALLAIAGALTTVGAGVEKLKGDAIVSAAALDATCCVVVVEASWCDAAAGGGAEKLNICVGPTVKNDKPVMFLVQKFVEGKGRTVHLRPPSSDKPLAKVLNPRQTNVDVRTQNTTTAMIFQSDTPMLKNIADQAPAAPTTTSI